MEAETGGDRIHKVTAPPARRHFERNRPLDTHNLFNSIRPDARCAVRSRNSPSGTGRRSYRRGAGTAKASIGPRHQNAIGG